MKDVIKIALGVATGLVVAGITWLTITAYIAKTALEEINKTSQNAVARIQLRSEANAKKQREYQARKEAEQRNAKAQEIRAQQAIIDSEKAAIKLRVEKAEAWKKFYIKSPECNEPPTMIVMGECANIAIRAKREFETQWSAKHATNEAVLRAAQEPVMIRAGEPLPSSKVSYAPPNAN